MRNKVWLNGKILSREKAKIDILTHTLHYGDGVFEGIRCYKTKDGPAIFRLKEHVERLFNSAKYFEMKIPYRKEEVEKAIIETIKANKLEECYIRPIVFYGSKIGLNPIGLDVNVAIITLPFDIYLGEKPIKAKISKFIRLHPKSVISSAKVCGYYVNSIFATLSAHKAGYDEAILLDYRGFVAEGSGENIFIVKNKIIYTPKLGSILPGITRDSIIKIAKDNKFKVIEKDISVKELKQADEAFFTGTAAEVVPIGQIDNKLINKGKEGEITKFLRETYKMVVRGEIEKYKNWLTYVK
jgi:branched-chain amino acid aminotransferase